MLFIQTTFVFLKKQKVAIGVKAPMIKRMPFQSQAASQPAEPLTAPTKNNQWLVCKEN